MIKKWRLKVLGGFRTQEEVKQFAAIRSYISTARKNSVNIFDAIQNVFSWDPFMKPSCNFYCDILSRGNISHVFIKKS
jgi:hypothetical protein